MALEALKCPQCGANLEVNATVRSFFCTYCGTKLQATVSSQGLVSASLLGAIKDDTSIMAKRTALSYLKEQAQELGERRTSLESEYQLKYSDMYIVENKKFSSIFRDTSKSPALLSLYDKYSHQIGDVDKKMAQAQTKNQNANRRIRSPGS